MFNLNLRPRLRNLVRKLVEAATVGDTDQFAYFATFNFTGADFQCKPPQKVPLEPIERDALVQERLISFDSVSGYGLVLDDAFEAVRHDFNRPAPAEARAPLAINNFHVSNVNTGGGHFQAVAGNNNIQQITAGGVEGFDLQALAGELGTLRRAMRKSAAEAENDDPEIDEAIGACAAAEAAAKKGDSATMLENLKKLGAAGLAKATEIGVDIAASAIAKVVKSD